MNRTIQNIGSGDKAIFVSVDKMIEFAKRDANSPVIRKLAGEIYSENNGHYEKTAIAVAEWVRDNIKYTSDSKLVQKFFDKDDYIKPENTEFIQRPEILLTKTDFEGDCDDMSTLLASLYLALGYEVNFKVVAYESNDYDHVFNEVKIEKTEKNKLKTHIWTPVDIVYMQKYNGKFGHQKENKFNRSKIIKVK